MEMIHNPLCEVPREILDLVIDMINFRLYTHKLNKGKKKRNNFVKIFFQGKDIERINLPSIFRKHVICLPSFLNYKDPPTIIYQRSKCIGSTIFNYKKVIDEVVPSEWERNNSHICDCENSIFKDPHHNHIVTSDLRFIKNSKLRSLLCKGPKYREAQNVNWKSFLEIFIFL